MSQSPTALTLVAMPLLSATMETGAVAKWRVAVGDMVNEGQLIADIETDKSVLEYESPHSGRVARLLVAEGVSEIPVGAPILELASSSAPSADAARAAPQVAFAAAAPAQPAPGALRPFSSVRRAIASKVSESKRTIPHFYAAAEFSMDEVMAALHGLRAAGGAQLSVNDFVIRAVAVALRSHPNLNVTASEEGTLALTSFDVGVAIGTAEGVFMPVVRGADTKSLAEIAREVARLRAAAEQRSLGGADFSGASVSVSNLGMFGVDSFAAIISPPQVMILAIGRVAQRPIVRDGALAVGYTMKCVLSCDHRVVDGVQAASFLKTLRGVCAAAEIMPA